MKVTRRSCAIGLENVDIISTSSSCGWRRVLNGFYPQKYCFSDSVHLDVESQLSFWESSMAHSCWSSRAQVAHLDSEDVDPHPHTTHHQP